MDTITHMVMFLLSFFVVFLLASILLNTFQRVFQLFTSIQCAVKKSGKRTLFIRLSSILFLIILCTLSITTNVNSYITGGIFGILYSLQVAIFDSKESKVTM